MREIKFRVWDEQRKTYHTSSKWVEFKVVNGVLTATNFGIGGEVQSLPVEQYTGLKDKNGVEIYEGDIVSIQYDLDEPTIHKVEWGGIDYPAFEFTPQLNCECNGFAHYYNDPDTIVEVIGNIHQNPELLEYWQ